MEPIGQFCSIWAGYVSCHRGQAIKDGLPQERAAAAGVPKDYPQAKTCLLYGGRHRLNIDGVPCLPCGEFLKDLHPDSAAPMD